MKILSIGNSFSQDTQRYLHKVAQANNKDIKCVNLYISGCPLRIHYLNMTDNERSYAFEFNGERTGIFVSIKDAIMSDDWDYVTLQQASHESFDITKYSPYIERLSEYIRMNLPDAKLLLHQTWAYPKEGGRVADMGFDSTKEMFKAVRKAYDKAAELIKPEMIIRSGEAMFKAYEMHPENLYRDAIHASLGYGRYLLACVWYKTLTGKCPKNHNIKFDEAVSKEEIEVIESILN